MRSCDSVGIREIYILYTEDQLTEDRLRLGRRTAMGTQKWVDVQYYRDPEACLQAVKAKYGRILATHLGEQAKSLYELDLNSSVALLFGNEHAGLSALSLANADGNFIIPQVGMV